MIVPGTDVRLVIVEQKLDRPEARLQLREAVLRALADEGERIEIAAVPGSPPRLTIDGQPAGISFSHAEGVSVAAIRRAGKVGLDIMAPLDIPDWHAVATDYLGPRVAAMLAASDDRARDLARAWTARESQLKLFGSGLDEWKRLPRCTTVELSLPHGLIGAISIES